MPVSNSTWDVPGLTVAKTESLVGIPEKRTVARIEEIVVSPGTPILMGSSTSSIASPTRRCASFSIETGAERVGGFLVGVECVDEVLAQMYIETMQPNNPLTYGTRSPTSYMKVSSLSTTPSLLHLVSLAC